MNEMKMYMTMICVLAVAITVGFVAEGAFDAWQAVEVARLRCAPSAAPAGNAP